MECIGNNRFRIHFFIFKPVDNFREPMIVKARPNNFNSLLMISTWRIGNSTVEKPNTTIRPAWSVISGYKFEEY